MYRIMLADDEGIMLEALKNIITSNFGDECEIATAKTGRAVVELAESFRPDIAFMDIQMPGINGIQAIKEIQKYNQNTIFIVISAYDKFCLLYTSLPAKRKLRWFINNSRIYESISVCQKHGSIKGKVRIRKTDDGMFYAVKTLKRVSEEKAEELREKRDSLRKKRRTKNQ